MIRQPSKVSIPSGDERVACDALFTRNGLHVETIQKFAVGMAPAMDEAHVIRISTLTADGRVIVSIAGRMTEIDGRELRRVRKSVGDVVELDLCGLDSSAPECIRVLREWMAAGATLGAASPFLSMVLKEPTTTGSSGQES